MNYEQKNIPITKLVSNSGQIAGVPKNPRTIKDARFRALVKSIEDAPEMLSLRELIVVPFGDKFVTICGNMRLSAARDLGMKSMPCKVLAEDTPAEKLREYAMKDNIAFGEDDIDLTLAEWDREELAEWGFELPEEEDYTGVEKRETTIQSNYLKFANYKIPVTDDEISALTQKLEKYSEEVGTMYGFVNFLITQ